jgi:hypothetical protein
LHCIIPLFRSMDAFFVQESWEHCQLSLNTLLQLPFTELYHQYNTEPSITHHNLILRKSANNFLEPSRLQDSLVFKKNAKCPNPCLLNKINRAASIDILIFTSDCNVYLSLLTCPMPPAVSLCGVNFSSYLCHKLNYQGIMALSMTNTQVHEMYMGDHTPISRPHVDLHRLTMASFFTPKSLVQLVICGSV